MGIFGSIARGIGQVAGAAFRATPIGMAASTVANLVSPPRAAPGGGIMVPSPIGPLSMPGTGNNPGVQLVGYGAAPVLQGPGPGTGMTRYQPGGIVSPMGTAANVPKGYHVNRTLVRAQVMMQNRGGLTPGMQRAVSQVVQAVTPNRRMNPCNFRALRRADRRARAFLKLSGKLVRHFTPRRPKGRAYVKASRRK